MMGIDELIAEQENLVALMDKEDAMTITDNDFIHASEVVQALRELASVKEQLQSLREENERLREELSGFRNVRPRDERW